MLTSDQIRAARALLKWTQEDLAQAIAVSVPTIKRWEAAIGVPTGNAKKIVEVRRVLEKAGVTFIEENGGGAGARLKKRSE
jgi:DNA-binding transcriptional regulator YiaG